MRTFEKDGITYTTTSDVQADAFIASGYVEVKGANGYGVNAKPVAPSPTFDFNIDTADEDDLREYARMNGVKYAGKKSISKIREELRKLGE